MVNKCEKKLAKCDRETCTYTHIEPNTENKIFHYIHRSVKKKTQKTHNPIFSISGKKVM